MDKEKKNKVINFKNFIKSKKNNKNFNNNNNIVKNTNDDLLINELILRLCSLLRL